MQKSLFNLKLTYLFFLLFFSLFSVLQAKEPLHIALSNNYLKPGETLKVIITSQKKIQSHKLTLNKARYSIFKRWSPENGPYKYVSYIGISRKLPIKLHRLYFDLTFTDGTQYKTRYKLFIQDPKFKKEYITLSKKKQSLTRDYKTINRENREIANNYIEFF